MIKNKTLNLLFVLGLGCGVAACSTTDTTGMNDPFEGTNRAIFAFNTAVDDAVIHPAIKGYRTVTPAPARSGLRNFLRNLKAPLRLANQLLQGDLDGAHNEVVRTAANSFIGLGLFDVAGYEGYEYEPEDFGQTLAVWGVGSGPYLVVPFLGSSSLRDYGGYMVDGLADPIRWNLLDAGNEDIYYTKLALDYLDLRDGLYDVQKDLSANSFDYYAAVRSTYYQNRQAAILENDNYGKGSASYADFDEVY